MNAIYACRRSGGTGRAGGACLESGDRRAGIVRHRLRDPKYGTSLSPASRARMLRFLPLFHPTILIIAHREDTLHACDRVTLLEAAQTTALRAWRRPVCRFPTQRMREGLDEAADPGQRRIDRIAGDVEPAGIKPGMRLQRGAVGSRAPRWSTLSIPRRASVAHAAIAC